VIGAGLVLAVLRRRETVNARAARSTPGSSS
jgi:hypothetical protein